MSSNANELFVEPRLLILKAAQNNDIGTITKLLNETPSLINAKTTTAGLSLLHLAAEAGHYEVCELLLGEGHETNPINKAGKTPWQCAKSIEIQSLLVNAHTDYLCNKFYTSLNIPKPDKPFISSLERIIQCKDKSEYSQIPMNTLGNHSFGFTMLRPAPYSSSGTDYGLVTVFRTDILMTPYYGELLVIHENEQAIQMIEKLANSKNGLFGNKEKFDMTCLHAFEVRAFTRFVSCGLKLYPFLYDYPANSDRADIAEAKKMFITFGLGGLASYLQTSTEQQMTCFKQLEDFDLVLQHLQNTISKKNSKKNGLIANQMESKFCSEEPSNITNNSIK